jgi:hypothetical protein
LGAKCKPVCSIAPQGILDRYRQVQPKFIFSETEAVYSGRTIDLLPKVTEVAQDLSSKGLRHVILLPSVKTGLEASLEIVESVSLRSVSNNIALSGTSLNVLSVRLCQRSSRQMMAIPSCLNNYRSISRSISSTHLARRAHQSALSTVQGYTNVLALNTR